MKINWNIENITSVTDFFAKLYHIRKTVRNKSDY